MAKSVSTIALEADPSDPDDFDVTENAVEQGLSERRARRRVRGAQKAATKQQVTLRIDPDLLADFKADGPGWQTRFTDAAGIVGRVRKRLIEEQALARAEHDEDAEATAGMAANFLNGNPVGLEELIYNLARSVGQAERVRYKQVLRKA